MIEFGPWVGGVPAELEAVVSVGCVGREDEIERVVRGDQRSVVARELRAAELAQLAGVAVRAVVDLKRR